MLQPVDFMTIEEMKAKNMWPLSYIAGKSLVGILKETFGTKPINGIEIGVCRGETTFTLLEQVPNIRKITAIDPYIAYDDWIGTIDQGVLDKFKEITKTNLKRYAKRYILVELPSAEAAPSIKDASMDFIFIDGDHSYKGVYEDLTNYYDKVKSGGVMAGHDINMNSVSSAISNFVRSKGLNIQMKTSENNLWYWIK